MSATAPATGMSLAVPVTTASTLRRAPLTSEHASSPGAPQVGMTTAPIAGETASKPPYVTSMMAGTVVASSAVSWTSATPPGPLTTPLKVNAADG